ncbi:MAG: xanthine dehydrogenase family protein molybdopterin-binding subunit, partial [Rhodospirillales bacterium]|nr:xanthine dehydrogenase family protein molybdopterin-binding subunit [Rhodospirillales bacterium]
RSPHAHALINFIDATAAVAAPGVLAVLTGADYEADGLKPIPPALPPGTDLALTRRDGKDAAITPLNPLAREKALRVGEVIALVVGETLDQARDAAEKMVVDYTPLPAVTDGRAAIAEGAPRLWDHAPGNIIVDDCRGNKETAELAFAEAAHTVSLELLNNRVTGVTLEARAAIGEYDAAKKHGTLYAGSGNSLRQRDALAAIFGTDESEFRVVCWNVGGAFGTRGMFYPEYALVMWAAKRVGRPVKWTCERSEAFLSDAAARDQYTHVELALNGEGRFLALRAAHIANLGSHVCSFVPLTRGISVTTSVYDIPVIYVDAKAVVSNTNPIHTYRGAGRPEAMYLVERLIDTAAREIGIDRVELRRRNLIPPEAMPYQNLTGMTFDSGEFEMNMDMALELAGWDGYAERREASAGRGKLRGIGLCNYIETATGIPPERAEIYIIPERRIELVVGTQDSGQGHATSYSQIISEWFGVPFEDIHLTEGDTDIVKLGNGSHSSRSMRLAGLLLGQARDDIIDRGREIASRLLEAAAADVEFNDGDFIVGGTDRKIDLFEIARAAEEDSSLPENLRGPLSGAAQILEPLPTFPNGCHICEVEIDPDTGGVDLVAYGGVDDVGRVISPMLVDGQTHGGIAQGVGQALLEDCTYDENGQLVAASFNDYGMPRADHFPAFKLENNEVLAHNNPLGIKGAGEGGATGAPPAVINAIVDALSVLGIRHLDMPATPERIWQAIRRSGVP